MPGIPARLHHSAVVVKNLATSKRFYEDIMGMPLVATWCESNEAYRDFCHAFFGLEDSSAVALFQFANDEFYRTVKRPAALSRFHHLALTGTPQYQSEVRARADAAGIDNYTINHGYVVSLYLDDPDGHVVEISHDSAVAIQNAAFIRERATGELERWLAGDHKPNNNLRDAR